jgi:hypothetical protein
MRRRRGLKPEASFVRGKAVVNVYATSRRIDCDYGSGQPLMLSSTGSGRAGSGMIATLAQRQQHPVKPKAAVPAYKPDPVALAFSAVQLVAQQMRWPAPRMAGHLFPALGSGWS